MKPQHHRQPPSPRLCLSVAAALATGLFWLAWPWLRPQLWPALGPDWFVVLDGYHRLDRALALQRHQPLPILLISCPATGQPTAQQWREARAPLILLRQGIDTAGQMAALGRWRPQLPKGPHKAWRPISHPAVVWLVSDPAHLPRAGLAAQIALGSSGTSVLPLPAPFPGRPPAVNGARLLHVQEDWPLWRDALRLQLWRLTGSTGAFLRPDLMRHKRSLCFGLQTRERTLPSPSASGPDQVIGLPIGGSIQPPGVSSHPGDVMLALGCAWSPSGVSDCPASRFGADTGFGHHHVSALLVRVSV